MRKITYPRMGPYTEVFEYLVTQLGAKPITPPKITQKTIKLGVRHSSDMVCFPFKVTLGNIIQGLDMGADTILAVGVTPDDEAAKCRFTYYYHIQEEILRRMGYKFDMIYIRGSVKGLLETFKDIKKINPTFGYLKTMRLIKNTLKKIDKIEKKEYKFVKKDINVGIVGEVYTLWESGVNYDIINKLRKMDVGVDLSFKLTDFLGVQLFFNKENEHYEDEVKKYFPKRIGGHGFESIQNTIRYAHEGFDGVIHLLPLSCMPETTVEMSMNMISEDYNIPVYRFPIDENFFETGFDTRLETFIKLLKRNKKKAKIKNVKK